MPLGEYEDFDDCVAKNQDKDDPAAYCAVIKQQIEGKAFAPQMERRVLPIGSVEVRTAGDATVIYGSAAVFNSPSEDLGGFVERIAPSAFDDVLNDDVRALVDHDPSRIIGRTKSGTLKLSRTEQGLMYEVSVPNTTVGRDIVESIKRGDVSGNSFSFWVAQGGDLWDEVEGRMLRTITKIARLFDVGPVTYPAYPDTAVAMRSLQQYQQAIKTQGSGDWQAEAEARQRTLQLRTRKWKI